MRNEELLDLIAAKLDADEILDILGWTTNELVYALREQISELEEEFKEAVEP